MSKITFAERLYILRTKKNLTQSQLANKIGVSFGTIKKWEIDTKPSYHYLEKLADYFGVTTDYLMGRITVDSNIPTVGLAEHEIDFILDLISVIKDKKNKGK